MGYTGSAGAASTATGVLGYTGSAGYTGSVGYTGSQGYTGSAGTTLTITQGTGISVSTSGTTVTISATGGNGYTGSQGVTGLGFTGSRGFTGSIGFTGSSGSGYTGSAGSFPTSTSNALTISNSTTNTSTNAGALVVTGGVGIGSGLVVNLIARGSWSPTITSTSTISPTYAINFVSGSATINTIVAPSPILYSSGQITLIPTGLWTISTSGNVALASTAIVNKALIMTFDGGTNKWYPSY